MGLPFDLAKHFRVTNNVSTNGTLFFSLAIMASNQPNAHKTHSSKQNACGFSSELWHSNISQVQFITTFSLTHSLSILLSIHFAFYKKDDDDDDNCQLNINSAAERSRKMAACICDNVDLLNSLSGHEINRCFYTNQNKRNQRKYATECHI